MHIDEKLNYCEEQVDGFFLKSKMETLDFDVFGIENSRGLKGYIEYSDLDHPNWTEHIKFFDSSELIANSTPLLDILPILKDKERIFVLYGNEVRGIITRGDLQKISVRMFLFGLISLLEMKMTKIIRYYYPADSWKDKISANRLKNADDLFQKQKDQHENMELLDCLQFADKNTIILRSEGILDKIPYSKNGIRRILNRSEQLRNYIAHSREFIEASSGQIIDLSLEIDNLLERISEQWGGI